MKGIEKKVHKVLICYNFVKRLGGLGYMEHYKQPFSLEDNFLKNNCFRSSRSSSKGISSSIKCVSLCIGLLFTINDLDVGSN